MEIWRKGSTSIYYIGSFVDFGYLIFSLKYETLKYLYFIGSLEDFDGEEVDEEALIEQRRQQRMAIVQVTGSHSSLGSCLFFHSPFI